MIRLRKAEDRGHSEHGWLHSHHTFSFSDYSDSAHMGHSVLRVINDDTVEPDQGFGTHPHRDMEIISYVLEGELEHKDSMGNGSVIRQGDVQRMSAGTGVTHSEFNPSQKSSTHFLQIWILPDQQGYEPSYEQKSFSEAELTDQFRCVVSDDGRDGSVSVHQNIQMYLARLNGEESRFVVEAGRCAYVHLAKGEINLNGEAMHAGDGAYIDDAGILNFEKPEQAEILLFDLPDKNK